MDVPRHQCVFVNCTNSRNTSDLSFFTFPVLDEKRCKQWIINSGNLNLFDIDKNKLRFKVVCEKHFLSKFILFGKKKRLTTTAVPTKYDHEQKKNGKENLTVQNAVPSISKIINIFEDADENSEVSSKSSLKIVDSENVHTYLPVSKDKCSDSDSNNLLQIMDKGKTVEHQSESQFIISHTDSNGDSSDGTTANAIMSMQNSKRKNTIKRLKRKIIKLKKIMRNKNAINRRLRQKALNYFTRNVFSALLPINHH